MPMTVAFPESSAADLARECLYRFLSIVVAGPYSASWKRVQDAENQRLALIAAERLCDDAASDPGSLALGELPPHDLQLADLLGELHKPAEELCAEYDRVFGLVIPKDCPPYETEYHPTSEPSFRSQQLADVARFYRAHGIMPGLTQPERPDHLSLELEFMAFLLMKKRLAVASLATNPKAGEQARVCDRAQEQFFSDHLAWWVPAFAIRLRRKARCGYNDSLARVLGALISAERHRLGVATPEKPVEPALIDRPVDQGSCSSLSVQA